MLVLPLLYPLIDRAVTRFGLYRTATQIPFADLHRLFSPSSIPAQAVAVTLLIGVSAPSAAKKIIFTTSALLAAATKLALTAIARAAALYSLLVPQAIHTES